ncbi:MAG: HNH endonuclease [Dehalococcoidia bacterium]|nr:HNH endonuclease [Dehalococcoidia bacterium]
MCQAEGASLQRGMNYRQNRDYSVILMSRRPNAPYPDRVEDEGRTLIYEGHDVPKSAENPVPKLLDQEPRTPGGSLTQNGLFHEAALLAKRGDRATEPVKVYEKIKDGIWVFNGVFDLLDAWTQESGGRQVFKFRLEVTDRTFGADQRSVEQRDLDHTRLIPSSVKLEVWKRDRGRCVLCQSQDNLHFDHDLPFSKGGTSLTAQNIRLLCARHNFAKGANIQ